MTKQIPDRYNQMFDTNITSNADVEFSKFLVEIKQTILTHQYTALKAVNHELINLYREIGKHIITKQQQFGWGKSVIEQLARELQSEFIGIKGFSSQNLWNMRQFYLEYKNNTKLQTLSGEISWSHNILIFQRCKEDLEREFYIKSTLKNNWSYRVLANQIDNNSYEKYILNQNNFSQVLPNGLQINALLSIKDEYNFDFLELGDKHTEKDLELGLIGKVREFLSQMGADYSFIGNQYRLEIDEEEYFIDLLLYHRRIKSLIAIELKIGKFKPEYAGKMNFYLAILDDTVKLKDENPSIGIIICKEKNRTTVEYALKNTTQPIGVATYNLTSNLPDNLKKLLPSPEEISIKLDGLYNLEKIND